MWNKRKEDEYPARPAPTPASPASAQRETNAPMNTAAASSYNSVDRGTAMIGKSVTIKGQIFSREDLTVDGEVEGSIELQEHRLTIGPHGKIHAGVKAREIVVLGSINGNVEASDKIDIRKDAKLVGDIKTARIVIEDGAYFKGSIDITKSEAKPVPPQQAPKITAPQYAGPSAGQAAGQGGGQVVVSSDAAAAPAPAQTFAAPSVGGGNPNTGPGNRRR
ncbi:MAG: polymer-forming cytoskeletal protein [Acidobacteriota bacterium]|nr:polymer-forming cytoskeletal protein [Acidobacteriota bacterium]